MQRLFLVDAREATAAVMQPEKLRFVSADRCTECWKDEPRRLSRANTHPARRAFGIVLSS